MMSTMIKCYIRMVHCGFVVKSNRVVGDWFGMCGILMIGDLH